MRKHVITFVFALTLAACGAAALSAYTVTDAACIAEQEGIVQAAGPAGGAESIRQFDATVRVCKRIKERLRATVEKGGAP